MMVKITICVKKFKYLTNPCSLTICDTQSQTHHKSTELFLKYSQINVTNQQKTKEFLTWIFKSKA